MTDSVSVIIPAFNEEENIQKTIQLVQTLVRQCINDFEIVVVNDGSIDRTEEIIWAATKKSRQVRLVSHKTNEGLGKALRDGFRAASKTYVTGYPADNDQSSRILTDLIRNRKKADLVSSYVTNLHSRPFVRRVISVFFVNLMNAIFRLHLKYYNGYFICRRDLLEKISLFSEGFTIFAEVKVKLIKKGVTFVELPYKTAPRLKGNSKALRFKNIVQTILFIPQLFKDIYL